MSGESQQNNDLLDSVITRYMIPTNNPFVFKLSDFSYRNAKKYAPILLNNTRTTRHILMCAFDMINRVKNNTQNFDLDYIMSIFSLMYSPDSYNRVQIFSKGDRRFLIIPSYKSYDNYFIFNLTKSDDPIVLLFDVYNIQEKINIISDLTNFNLSYRGSYIRIDLEPIQNEFNYYGTYDKLLTLMYLLIIDMVYIYNKIILDENNSFCKKIQYFTEIYKSSYIPLVSKRLNGKNYFEIFRANSDSKTFEPDPKGNNVNYGLYFKLAEQMVI